MELLLNEWIVILLIRTFVQRPKRILCVQKIPLQKSEKTDHPFCCLKNPLRNHSKTPVMLTTHHIFGCVVVCVQSKHNLEKSKLGPIIVLVIKIRAIVAIAPLLALTTTATGVVATRMEMVDAARLAMVRVVEISTVVVRRLTVVALGATVAVHVWLQYHLFSLFVSTTKEKRGIALG